MDAWLGILGWACLGILVSRLRDQSNRLETIQGMGVSAMRKPRLPPTIAQLTRGGKSLAHPEPGYFQLRVRRKPAAWVPALIWMPCLLVFPEEDGDPPEHWCYGTDRGARTLLAHIGGKDADPLFVWERGQRITAQEYHWRMSLRDWAITYAPEQPEAKPERPVDLARLPSLF